MMSLWVAFFVVITADGSQVVSSASTPFAAKAECVAANEQVKEATKEIPRQAIEFKCVEVKLATEEEAKKK